MSHGSPPDDERPSFSTAFIRLVNSGAALGAAAAAAIGAILVWGYRTNIGLEAEITRLRGEQQVLIGLQRDNRRLRGLTTEAAELKREVAELPALRSAVRPPVAPPPSGAVSLTVSPEGTIRWENADVSPAEFIRLLRNFRTQYPARDSSVVVRAAGGSLSAVAYLLDEARKAQIERIIVEGEPKTDGGAATWFQDQKLFTP